MARSYVQLWDWFTAFGEQAINVKDEERTRLYRLLGKAFKERHKYPEQAVVLCREGIALAEDLKEPWVGLSCEFWLATLIFFKLNRYEDGLELAVKLVTKANQETFLNCPLRAPVFLLLIGAYFHLDGLSYIDEIAAMLDTLETQIVLDIDTHQRLVSCRADFLWMLGDLEKAVETTEVYLEMSESNDFRLADGYEMLCHFHYLRGSDQAALEYAHMAQESAKKSRRFGVVLSAQWWQAALLFLRGDPQEAERLFRLCIGEVSQLERPKDVSLWGGACRYYEVTGAYDKALLFWDEQIQLMNPQTPHRQSYFMIFLRRCFVLRKMGCLTEADIEQTRLAAMRMRKPEKYLAQIEKLHDGSLEIPRH